MIKLLRQVAYNVRHRTYFPITEHEVMMKLMTLRQEPGTTLIAYHEKFKHITDMMESLQVEVGMSSGMQEAA